MIEEFARVVAHVLQLNTEGNREEALKRLRESYTTYFGEDAEMIRVLHPEQLLKKLAGLDVTRLKEEHITKILDFLPQTPNDVKIIFQGYNVSLAKKDQESIAATVKEIVS